MNEKENSTKMNGTCNNPPIPYVKFFVLTLFLSLLFAAKAMATETLDCSCDQYLVRLHVGTGGYFSTVLLYEDGKEGYILYRREDMKTAYLNWKKKILKLEYAADSDSSSELASFTVLVNGKTQGRLRINNRTYQIKCWW